MVCRELPLHILIAPSWYPAHPGDINGVFFREQALALAKHGRKVGVIYPHLWSLRAWKSILSGKRGIELETDAGLPTMRSHGVNWFPRIRRAQHWLWRSHGLRLYQRYVDQHGRPDIIHVHAMLNAGALALAIQRRYGVPFVVTEHFSGYARGAVRGDRLRIARAVARRAARRFAVSRPFCDLLEGLLGTGPASWEEMPNIVEQRFLERSLRERNRPKDHFRFVNVALLTENKGIENLIRAFAKTFAEEADVTLDVGGDGPERLRLEAIAAELGVAGRVRFLGALDRDQVADVVAASDAFVLASRYETFGVVVIEALALGKPVIATRCGGPDAIVRKQDGLQVPPDDIDALASAMRWLRANADQYNPDSIRAGCRKRYSEKAVTDRLTQVYQDVVRHSDTGAP